MVLVLRRQTRRSTLDADRCLSLFRGHHSATLRSMNTTQRILLNVAVEYTLDSWRIDRRCFYPQSVGGELSLPSDFRRCFYAIFVRW